MAEVEFSHFGEARIPGKDQHSVFASRLSACVKHHAGPSERLGCQYGIAPANTIGGHVGPMNPLRGSKQDPRLCGVKQDVINGTRQFQPQRADGSSADIENLCRVRRINNQHRLASWGDGDPLDAVGIPPDRAQGPVSKAIDGQPADAAIGAGNVEVIVRIEGNIGMGLAEIEVGRNRAVPNVENPDTSIHQQREKRSARREADGSKQRRWCGNVQPARKAARAVPYTNRSVAANACDPIPVRAEYEPVDGVRMTDESQLLFVSRRIFVHIQDMDVAVRVTNGYTLPSGRQHGHDIVVLPPE